MPRTKLSKNTKRNRDAEASESLALRLRELDSILDESMAKLDLDYRQEVENNSRRICILKRKIPANMLTMKMKDLRALDINTYEEFNVMWESMNPNKSMLNITQQSTKKKSRDDEGYLTEDSASNLNARQSTRRAPGRPIGPLCSAKAKARTRRSRSACGYLQQITSSSSNTSSLERSSRSKMRTPLNRIKAISADRATPVTPKIAPNTPLSVLRYPKVGETVISLTGSPVVVQSLPDSTANVNIPIKNGIISLRPNKIESLDPDFISRIDIETLNQIKQLQSNLNFIMNAAGRSDF